MAKFTQTYQTDLKYTEWELIQEYFLPYKLGLFHFQAGAVISRFRASSGWAV
jgi:hypothetical protein